MTFNFKNSGDLGDMVYTMPIIEALGGGNLYSSRSKETRVPMTPERLEIIKPLLQSQPYIGEVEMVGTQNIHYDLDEFRVYMSNHLTYGHTLADYHLEMHGLAKSTVEKPWIRGIQPSPMGGKKVVINRTERYINPIFPWARILSEWGRQSMLFVGTEKEHQLFEQEHGQIDYRKTDNLLEVARLIAGAQWFIGNQSVCFSVAEGMKANVIQETWAYNPDCLYRRPNAIHVAGDYIELPSL